MMKKIRNEVRNEVDEMIKINDLENVNGGGGSSGSMVLYMQIVAKITGKKCPGCNHAFRQLSNLNATDYKELGNARVRCPSCHRYYAWTQFK